MDLAFNAGCKLSVKLVSLLQEKGTVGILDLLTTVLEGELELWVELWDLL